MEKIHNKLVRDMIPEIIESTGEKYVIRVLDDDEYKCELYKKLQEECLEVVNSKNNDEILEELADVLEVLKAIAKLNEKSFEDVINIANKKTLKRGAFDKRIYLEKTIKR